MNNSFFFYVKGQATGKSVVQYNSIPYRSCKRILFVKKCKTKHRKVKRGLDLMKMKLLENL